MQLLSATCPICAEQLTIGIDDSTGPPEEAGEECPRCHSIPVWRVQTLITYMLDGIAYYERISRPKEGAPDA